MLASDASAVTLMDALAYDAAFPDNSFKSGVRRFPQLVPVEPTMDGVQYGLRARKFRSNSWTGESFTAIVMKDVVLGEGPMEKLRLTTRS